MLAQLLLVVELVLDVSDELLNKRRAFTIEETEDEVLLLNEWFRPRKLPVRIREPEHAFRRPFVRLFSLRQRFRLRDGVLAWSVDEWETRN